MGDLDDLDQFRLIVEQLEVCRDLVLRDAAPKSRMALILLDNAAEVILYRVSREALDYDEFARRIVPVRFSLKQRNAMERFFEPKLDCVASKKEIDVGSVEMLRVLHRYRNAAVHRDTHNPAVIPILARLAFLAVSRLFASTRGGVRPSMAGGYTEPIDWLAPYGLARTFIDYETAAQQIALQIQTRVEVLLGEAREGLAEDLRERVRRIHQVLSSELPLGDDTGRIDDMLKWFEFRNQFPDLEYTLSERYRSLRYKMGEGSGDQVARDEFVAAEEEFQEYDAQFASYQAQFTCGRLATVGESIDSVGRATAFNELLTAYAQIDETVTLYERLVGAARDSYEAQVQMEIDISRGK
ncbi:MAG TPA: hypothetical protein VMW56_27130 [Candidatus Margulisiibacteriota bacterium]|nr:hypothetical protein [Candidatus Margulisiibacteriota bacterium]